MPVRRVLITRASKGIGRAVTDRVARAGNVAIGLARTAPAGHSGRDRARDLFLMRMPAISPGRSCAPMVAEVWRHE
jgi:NAD(P)-dependent dehydrogenase (short-subunit alcohol dehydrogenase family)